MGLYYVGLDLSLTDSGVSVINETGQIQLLTSIISKNTENLPNIRFKRWNGILEGIYPIFKKYEIEVVAIENYAFAAKGAITQLAESGGLIRNFIFWRKCHMIEIAPIQLKKFILGHVDAKGKDKKNIMCREVYKKYNEDINNDNQVDAFLLSQIALLYDFTKKEIVKNIKLPVFKYQEEIITKIMGKEDEEKKRIEKRKK